MIAKITINNNYFAMVIKLITHLLFAVYNLYQQWRILKISKLVLQIAMILPMNECEKMHIYKHCCLYN